MSKFTSILGGIVGAVIGFIYGNVPGAFIGFAVGYGLGSFIDPTVPDIAQPGEPMGELEIMTNNEGIPLPDVLGTTKMTGNLLYYGNNWRQTLTHEVDTGGLFNGSQTVVDGYRYYLSWAMGFCLGPVDTLYTVWMDDTVVWAGELERSAATNGQLDIALWKGDRKDLSYYEGLGETDGWLGQLFSTPEFRQELMTRDGYVGTMTFYYGTSDQVVNDELTDLMIEEGAIEDETWALPYRNQCWAYMHNCHIGDFNRCPTIRIIVRKAPECSFDT